MKPKLLFHIFVLLLALSATSAFKFRCYWFCTDQTGVQTDYVMDRDECRQYAQLRLETDTSSPELVSGNARKAKLISLFSSCMGDKGWTVPDGGGSGPAENVPIPIPAVAAAPIAPAPQVRPLPVPASAIMTEPQAKALKEQAKEKTYLARSSECAFARHSAAYSTVARKRAEACDIECQQRREKNPHGKRPAACPADLNELDINQ